jgi:RNA polymerase primary sigma factor
MSVAELQELEEVKGLIVRGLQVGVLTYAEIATATAEVGLEETDVEELHGPLDPLTAEASMSASNVNDARSRGLRVPPRPRGNWIVVALDPLLSVAGSGNLFTA